MLGSDVVTYLKQLTGNRVSATIDDAWYLARVNEGYRRLATLRHKTETGLERIIRFPQLHDKLRDRVLTSGMTNNWYANQANVYSVLALYNRTLERPVEYQPIGAFHSLNRNDDGDVQIWTPYGDAGVAGYMVWARPRNDTTVDEFVYKFPETLLVGSTPVIDEEWHELIAEAVASRVARLHGNEDRAVTLEKQFVEHVATARLPDEETMRSSPRWWAAGAWRS